MKKIIILYIFTLLTGFATNLSHPVTPLYITQLGVEPYMFGLFFAAMNTGMFIMAPIWGNLGDIRRRKFIVLIAFIGYGIAQAGFAYFSNPFHILGVRFMAGFFSCAISTSLLAYIIEDSDFRNKSRIISVHLALTMLGGSLAYLIGGFIGSKVDAPNLVIYMQAIVSFVMAALALLLDTKHKETSGEKRSLLSQFSQIKHLSAPLIFLIITMIIVNLAQVNFSRYIDLYVTDLGYLSSDIGNFVFTTGIITILVTLFLVPVIIRKFNKIWILIIMNLVGAVVTFITFSLDTAHIFVWLYSIYAVYVVTRAFYDPALVEHLSEYKDVSHGMLMGMRQSALSLGAIIGPVLAGVIYGYVGVYLFYILSLLLGVSVVMFIIYKYWRRRVHEAERIHST